MCLALLMLAWSAHTWVFGQPNAYILTCESCRNRCAEITVRKAENNRLWEWCPVEGGPRWHDAQVWFQL